MCQMIIHATARDTTMLQAVAHNIHTSESDLETLERVLQARGQATCGQLAALARARASLQEIETDLLELFSLAVERHPHTAGDHTHCDAHPHGVSIAEPAQSV